MESNKTDSTNFAKVQHYDENNEESETDEKRTYFNNQNVQNLNEELEYLKNRMQQTTVDDDIYNTTQQEIYSNMDSKSFFLENENEGNNFGQVYPNNSSISLNTSKISNQVKQYDEDYPLLEKLSEKMDNLQNKYSKLKTKYYDIGNKLVDLFFLEHCRISKLQLNKYFFMNVLVMNLCLLAYLLVTEDSQFITSHSVFNNMKKYVGKNLVAGAIIFTYYGIIFLEIKNKFIFIFLFFAQFIPCLIVALKISMDYWRDKQISELPDESFILSIYVGSLYIFWLIVSLLAQDIKSNFSHFWKQVMIYALFIICGLILGGLTIYRIITTPQIDSQWVVYYIQDFSVPYMFNITLIWVYIYQRFLKQRDREIQHESQFMDKKKMYEISYGVIQSKEQLQAASRNQALNNDQRQQAFVLLKLLKKVNFTFEIPKNENQGKQDQNQKQVQPQKGRMSVAQLQKNVSQIIENKISMFDAIMYYLYLKLQTVLNHFTLLMLALSGAGLYTVVALIVIYSFLYIKNEMSNVYNMGGSYAPNMNSIYICVFYIFGAPFVTYFFVIFIALQLKQKYKFFIYAIIGVIIPLCITLPMKYYMQGDPTFDQLLALLIFGPPATAIMVSTIIYISYLGRRISYASSIFFVLFFAVSLGFLYPVSTTDAFDDRQQVAIDTYKGLYITGIIIIVLYLLKYVFKIISQIDQKNTQKKNALQDDFNELLQGDYRNFGYWINSVGFAVVVLVLLYGYFVEPEKIHLNFQGSIKGQLIVVIFLFLVCYLALYLKVVDEKQVELLDETQKKSKLINFLMCKQSTFTEKYYKQIYIRRVVMLFGYIIIPVIIIPFLVKSVQNNDKDTQSGLIAILVGSVACALIFSCLNLIKRKRQQTYKAEVPIIVAFIWIFIFLPLGIFIPLFMNNLGFLEYYSHRFPSNLFQLISSHYSNYIYFLSFLTCHLQKQF